MASTNKTTNYELSQFVETDRPAWLTDYNGDMRKLDTALKVVSDVASGASSGISSLTDRMTAAEGAITTNANDITALDARADALEAGAQSTAGTIANIQTEQTAQNLGIEAATELGYNLARPYDSASTYAVGAYVLFQNTLYKCITAVSVGEAFDPTKWLAIKATDEIAAGGYTLPTASASTLGGVKVGDGLSIDGSGVLSPNLEKIKSNYAFTNITEANGATISQATCDFLRIGNIKIYRFRINGDSTHRSNQLIFNMTKDADVDAPIYQLTVTGGGRWYGNNIVEFINANEVSLTSSQLSIAFTPVTRSGSTYGSNFYIDICVICGPQ